MTIDTIYLEFQIESDLQLLQEKEVTEMIVVNYDDDECTYHPGVGGRGGESRLLRRTPEGEPDGGPERRRHCEPGMVSSGERRTDR